MFAHNQKVSSAEYTDGSRLNRAHFFKMGRLNAPSAYAMNFFKSVLLMAPMGLMSAVKLRGRRGGIELIKTVHCEFVSAGEVTDQKNSRIWSDNLED